jgi:hypothetical protein
LYLPYKPAESWTDKPPDPPGVLAWPETADVPGAVGHSAKACPERLVPAGARSTATLPPHCVADAETEPNGSGTVTLSTPDWAPPEEGEPGALGATGIPGEGASPDPVEPVPSDGACGGAALEVGTPLTPCPIPATVDVRGREPSRPPAVPEPRGEALPQPLPASGTLGSETKEGNPPSIGGSTAAGGDGLGTPTLPLASADADTWAPGGGVGRGLTVGAASRVPTTAHAARAPAAADATAPPSSNETRDLDPASRHFP